MTRVFFCHFNPNFSLAQMLLLTLNITYGTYISICPAQLVEQRFVVCGYTAVAVRDRTPEAALGGVMWWK